MPEPAGPAYRRVLTELRELILSGHLTEGDQLPSVRVLAAQHDVPTGTVARAIEGLRAEGLIVSRHGAGTFVRGFRRIRRSSPSRLARQQWGEGREIPQADTGDRPRAVNVEVGETEPPEWAAEPLRLGAGDQAVYRSRQFTIDGRAVQLATSYLPVDLARGTRIMHTDTGPGGIYARLAESGHAPESFTEYLQARMPRPDEVERLELSEGTPVVEITRHAFDQDGRCVEVNRMILDGSIYLLDYTFRADLTPT